jgi:hypothetical protein
MIWILVSLFACTGEAKISQEPVTKRVEVNTVSKEQGKEQKKLLQHADTKSEGTETTEQNSGEIHTQIGQKKVDITYEHMEDIKGTEDGKKIKGLNLKIGNMEIKVDEVEFEGLKVEKE